jgi:hypothetical protein
MKVNVKAVHGSKSGHMASLHGGANTKGGGQNNDAGHNFPPVGAEHILERRTFRRVK